MLTGPLESLAAVKSSHVLQRPLLSQEECHRAVQNADQLKSFWMPVGHVSNPGYFILPTSMYYRLGNGGFQLYRKQWQQTNPILKQHLGWLYELVFKGLEQIFNRSVCLIEEASHPGFHIYYRPISSNCSIHYDLQFLSYPWQNISDYETTKPISFTLPVSIPTGEVGLNVWDVLPSTEDEVRHQLHKPPTFVPYQLGHLYVISGLLRHQIAASPSTNLQQRRITLQGHGLFHRDGTLRIYW